MNITKSKITKWLGKKRMQSVDDIDLYDGVIDIMLCPNFHNANYGGGVYYFDVSTAGTQSEIKEDLIHWFASVEEI